MDENLLNKYKKEFRQEILQTNISIDNLKKIGVSDFTLLSEIFLRKYYGDDILLEEETETEIDLSKKKIEKVDLQKINSVSELSKYIEDISKSEFDSNVEMLLTKIENDDD